eukprot:12646243-Alexandrium_andersonii.AAC.1
MCGTPRGGHAPRCPETGAAIDGDPRRVPFIVGGEVIQAGAAPKPLPCATQEVAEAVTPGEGLALPA